MQKAINVIKLFLNSPSCPVLNTASMVAGKWMLKDPLLLMAAAHR